jgi:hypothetical protein
MTRWVALLLRFCALWFGWRAFLAIMDLFSAMQVLHVRPGVMPGWASTALDHLSQKYTHTPNEISTAIYRQIGETFFMDLLWTIVLWTGCRRIAGGFTEGLDNTD